MVAFLLTASAEINEIGYEEQQLLLFEKMEGIIEVKNTLDTALTVIVFGGAPYTEPIVAQGPFLMNSEAEIATAYDDFFLRQIRRHQIWANLNS